MARSERLVIPSLPHHVTHRGNNRQPIFDLPDDYPIYLNLLKKHCSRYGLAILGWCLMTNHVHLIVVPARKNSLANGIGKAHGHFGLYMNRIRGTTGHAWEHRFHSCPMDDNHLMHALRYVDRNPVRAGLVTHALEYGWSSAKTHVTGTDELGLIDLKTWSAFLENTGIIWLPFINQTEDQADLEELRTHTLNGIFLGANKARGQAPDSNT